MLTAPATQLPDAFSERAALLRAQLSRRRAIVILDDAGQHEQIRPLLPEAGHCLILITTRRRFPGLEGARALTLDALPVNDAITLLQLVAGPGTAHDEGEAARAVRLCGRLPLAIQLAAGRLAQDYPPRLGELVEELSQSPARSGGSGPSSPEVMSAFDLAYRALEPAQRRFFRRLGMSPCAHISLGAAAALGGGTLADAQQAMAALLDHHLLARAPAGQYRFHDLIRGYAATRAGKEDSRSERRQAIGRLLDYYLRRASEADQLLHPFRQRAPQPATSRTAPQATGKEQPRHRPAGRPQATGPRSPRGKTRPAGWNRSGATSSRPHSTRPRTNQKRSARTWPMRWPGSWTSGRSGVRRSPPTRWPCRPAAIWMTRPGSRGRPWNSAR